MHPTPPADLGSWTAREAAWRRKLGRLRLGVEPLDRQLDRYRRATLVLTAVCVGLGLMFLALFSAFRRPDVGAILAGVLLVPIVLIAWADFGLLTRRARAYQRERDAYLRDRNGLAHG